MNPPKTKGIVTFYSQDNNYLDVSKQYAWMKDTKPLVEGLREAFDWYVESENEVGKKPYLEYIEKEKGDIG